MAKVKDPVCGMQIEDSTEFFATHEGKKYHFCATACKEKFEENPAEFLKGAGITIHLPKISFDIWWHRIVVVFVIALVISVSMFFIKEKPFSEESQLHFQNTDEEGHYDPPSAGEHEHN